MLRHIHWSRSTLLGVVVLLVCAVGCSPTIIGQLGDALDVAVVASVEAGVNDLFAAITDPENPLFGGGQTGATGQTGQTAGAGQAGGPVNVAGDAAAGQSKFTSSLCSKPPCASCHGPEGAGVIGPNIQGRTADFIKNKLTNGPHAGGIRDCLADQDFADLAAFLGQ